MFWIAIALLGPIFHAAANILDNVLANRKLKSLPALIFYSSLFNLLFLPIVLVLDPPSLPSLPLSFLVLFLGLTNALYLFPYYRALQSSDTSIAISLFSLTRVLIPVFSYLFVGERLLPGQYVGFLVIVLASTLVTFEPKRIRFNASLGYMFLASLAITAESVVFKFLFENGVSWGTAFGGQLLASFLWVLPLLLVPRLRRVIAASWTTFRKSAHLLVVEEFCTFAGTAAGTYAITYIPLTFGEAVESFQPLFALLYAVLLARFLPHIFKERIDRKSLSWKLFFFSLMALGVYFMAR